MNILLTTTCNRRDCTFCFEQSVPEIKARHSRDGSGTDVFTTVGNAKEEFITASNYAYLLRLAEEWQVPRICLLGGEPTQHRMIAKFVQDALKLGRQVMIATNGVIHSPRSDELRTILYSAEGRQLLFLLNPYLRPNQPSGELAAIEQNLEWMQRACTLGTNIWTDDFDLTPYARMVSRFHLNTMIRVSLSHPMVDHENAFAATRNYQRIGDALKKQGRELLQTGIRLFCDCGFVACMFAKGDGEPEVRAGLAELAECGILYASICNPLPDIHPDLSASYCLPLASRMRLNLDPAVPLERRGVLAALGTHFKSLASHFLFHRCEACGLRRSGECSAGCLAHRLRLQERH
jgi:hypothetical protein